MRMIAAVGLALALAGCGPSGTARVSRMIDLPASRPASYASWVADTNSQIRANVPLTSKGETFLAYRTALAAEVGAGRMTPEQMDYASRVAIAEIEGQQRAERAAALRQIGQGLSQMGQAVQAAQPPAVQPVYQAPQNTTVNCTSLRNGNMTTTNCY